LVRVKKRTQEVKESELELEEEVEEVTTESEITEEISEEQFRLNNLLKKQLRKNQKKNPKCFAGRSYWNFGRVRAKIGTYLDGGNIYASASGIVKINNKERSISVIPVTNTPPHLNVGDIVIGQVTDVKDSVALVEIAGIKGKGEREIVNAEQAAIHVSNVKDAYVRNCIMNSLF